MDPITAKLMSAAGAAADPIYVDDVFSTFLYDGTSSAQTITNGIDLSGEGGLVWLKDRTSGWAHQHHLIDSERGTNKHLHADSAVNEATSSTTVTAFNSDGFSIGTNGAINYNGNIYCSWTFRKCPGFFDVVTFTSNNSASGVTVSHNLGSTPGSIWVKSTSDASTNWWVWHRSAAVDSSPPSGVPSGSLTIGKLNSNDQFSSSSNIINTVTSTSFKYGMNGAGYNDDTNTTFVAYIFAHDDQSFGDDSDEAIVKCGSYTGNSSTSGNDINVGFEPQWLLIKNSSSNGYAWILLDTMRGIVSGGNDPALYTASSQAEDSWNSLELTPTGFNVTSPGSAVNNTGDTYIYIAIRRPHKPPVDADDVYAIDTQNSGSYSSPPYYRSNFVVDAGWRTYMPDGNGRFGARMLGGKYFQTHSTAAASTDTYMFDWDYNNGFGGSTVSGSSTDTITHMLKRAPGFFDVVVYEGASGAQTINHNLGVTPELIIIKKTSEASYYPATVYHGTTGNLLLNDFSSGYGSNNAVNHSNISATTFEVKSGSGDVNDVGETHVAYLFASLAGISKVGSYTGTGSDLNIDCGFTAGARFVLIKRTDSTGDWFLFDTKQGIVSGNDPYWRPNTSSPQVTGNDYIDPLSSGFTITSSAPAGLNASSGTYLFLAIA